MTLALLAVVAVQNPQCPPTIVPSTATIEFTNPPRGRVQDFDMASWWICRIGPRYTSYVRRFRPAATLTQEMCCNVEIPPPRLTASFQARKSLQSHQLGLVERLHTSARALRATQEEAFAVLPATKPPGLREDAVFSECLTLEGLDAKIESEKIPMAVPHFTVLRCALASGKLDRQPTTEELFKSIEDHFPRLGLATTMWNFRSVSYRPRWSPITSHATVGSAMGNVKYPPSHTSDPRQRTHPPGNISALTSTPPTQYLTSLDSLSKSLPSKRRTLPYERNWHRVVRSRAGSPSISTCSRR
jgi:hypothetical protein